MPSSRRMRFDDGDDILPREKKAGVPVAVWVVGAAATITLILAGIAVAYFYFRLFGIGCWNPVSDNPRKIRNSV